MDVTLLARQRLIVVHISGEIDHYSAAEIRAVLERGIKRTGAINIAMDLGRVSFMDSSGIGMIMGRYKTVKALGGELIIYDASAQVERLLEMAGMKKLVIMCDTLQQGIDLIKKEVNV